MSGASKVLYWAWVEYHEVELPDGLSMDEVVRRALCAPETVSWFGARSERQEDGTVERLLILYWLGGSRSEEYWRERLSLGLHPEQVADMELKDSILSNLAWASLKEATIAGADAAEVFGSTKDFELNTCVQVGVPLCDAVG